MWIGLRRLFRMMATGLLASVAFVLFIAPPIAYAHGDRHVSASAAPAVQNATIFTKTNMVELGNVGSIIKSTALDGDGCDKGHGHSMMSGCCTGASCPMMAGILPSGAPSVSFEFIGAGIFGVSSNLLSGVSASPALRPPRASV